MSESAISWLATERAVEPEDRPATQIHRLHLSRSNREMVNTSRRSSARIRRAGVVGTSVTILLATLASVSAAGSQAAGTSHAASAKCHLVITGAPWSIRTRVGRVTGSKYTLAADGVWCSAGRPWVMKFTHQKGKGLGTTLHGPRGLTCHSLSTPVSGDNLVYAGVCAHGTGYKPPGFGWAPQIKR